MISHDDDDVAVYRADGYLVELAGYAVGADGLSYRVNGLYGWADGLFFGLMGYAVGLGKGGGETPACC